jgi:hypothetical protein
MDSYKQFLCTLFYFIRNFYFTSNKTTFCLCWNNEAPRREDVWGSGSIAPTFLTLAQMEVSGQLHAPAVLPPKKESMVPTGLDAGWARAGLGAVGKRKISCPCRQSNPGRRARRPSPLSTELSRLDNYLSTKYNIHSSVSCCVSHRRAVFSSFSVQYGTNSPFFNFLLSMEETECF